MSVITQEGYSVLMMAASDGRTEVVSLLLDSGANTDLQNMACLDQLESVLSKPIPAVPAVRGLQ